MIKKVIFYSLTLMFMSFAFVQLNDPDALLWFLIYAAMAVVCVMASLRYFLRPLLLALSIAYVGLASTLFSSIIIWLKSEDKGLLLDDVAKMQHPYIEESREFLGLLICLAVLGLCWAMSKRR